MLRGSEREPCGTPVTTLDLANVDSCCVIAFEASEGLYLAAFRSSHLYFLVSGCANVTLLSAAAP